MPKSQKWVYQFKEGSAAMRDLLGGKGAGAAEMTRAGMPVPPGFTITTEACRAYLAHGGKFPPGLWDQVTAALKVLERNAGKKFGNPGDPLLVSVRSGAKFSMPGMMDTVLNLGLNEETAKGLAALTRDDRFALDARRRFIQMFGKTVKGIDGDKFEHALVDAKKARPGQDRPRTEAGPAASAGGAFPRHIQGRDENRISFRSRRAAARGDRGRVPLLEHRPCEDLPQDGANLGRPRHRGQRPDDGVREHGRVVGHRRCVH